MEQVFVFIYAKNKKIKVLSLEDSRKFNESLISEGWKHTQTIDVCIWIEHLYKKRESYKLLVEINGLGSCT